MPTNADVIIIGGGIHGLSTGLALARRRLNVVFLEREWIARHASGATAAGVRKLDRKVAEVPISLAASQIWQNMRDYVGDDCGFHAGGVVKLAETPEILDLLSERRNRMVALGYTHEELVDEAEIREIIPSLRSGWSGALICRSDGHADPHRTAVAFRRAAEREGVTIFENHGVTAARWKGQCWHVEAGGNVYSAPFVVNTSGSWGARTAAMLGEDLPLDLMVPMMMVTEPVAHFLEPVVSIHGRKLSFKQTGKGTLLLGGGYQGFGDLDTRQTIPSLSSLMNAAKVATSLFPQVGSIHIARVWAGLEALPKDKLPILERSRQLPNVVHSVGYSGHGFQLSPAMGQVVADLVTQGLSQFDLSPFRSDRHAITAPSAA